MNAINFKGLYYNLDRNESVLKKMTDGSTQSKKYEALNDAFNEIDRKLGQTKIFLEADEDVVKTKVNGAIYKVPVFILNFINQKKESVARFEIAQQKDENAMACQYKAIGELFDLEA